MFNWNTNISISHREFISNHYGSDMIHVSDGPITSIDHSKFISNIGYTVISTFDSMTTISIDQCKFTNNTVVNNTAETAVVYQTTAENLTGNVFIDNSAAYKVYVSPSCRSGLKRSLGSYRCIKCSEHWR